MAAVIKFKSQEEFDAFKEKAEREHPSNKPDEEEQNDQNVKTYYDRPDASEGSVEEPREQSERQELNRKLRAAQIEREKPPSTVEKIKRVAKIASEDIFGTAEERAVRAEKNKKEREEKEAKEKKEKEKDEKEEKKREKRDKKDKDDDDLDDIFGRGSRSSKRSSRGSPVGTYESAYHHNKPVPYETAFLPNKPVAYSEAYTARKLADNGVYKSPGNPKTYDLSHGEPQQQQQQQQPQRQEQSPRRPPQPTSAPQRARAPPMPMPTMGNFGTDGSIKMPTISLGGAPRMGSAHKMGPGNMPSINIPTLGGSTLMMGSGLMKKTANNKFGSGMFDVPTIGNWGKSTVKSKLDIPSIGGLNIMGSNKKTKGVGINMNGDIPKFGLAAPPKKKKKV